MKIPDILVLMSHYDGKGKKFLHNAIQLSSLEILNL